MRWTKRGLVFAPEMGARWMRSHAYLPTAHAVNAEVIRVYFASFDDAQRGRIGYVDVDSRNPHRILGLSEQPVLDLGEAGTFDEDGVSPCSVVRDEGRLLLYYFGWQRLSSVPYVLFAGLAISTDGGLTFQRGARVPILDRTDDEPHVRSAPCVLVDNGVFRMWYVAGQGWTTINRRTYPMYGVRTLRSHDGVHWVDRPGTCIELQAGEFGLGRPWVMRDQDGYRMWYSVRSYDQPYRLGYAESVDGSSWTRRDADVGITRAESSAWDSEMLCFGCVIDVAEKRYLFYNGNDHGRTGFGYAELAED